MKKFLSIENIYKVFVILAATVIVFALHSEVFAEGNPTEKTNIIWTDEAAFEKWQFEQAQFLTRISNKALVNEFLFLCENSSYIATVENWNRFIKNYKAFYSAYKAYKQGFTVEFDDIL